MHILYNTDFGYIIYPYYWRRRKNSKSFAVHYLKEGPKVDQSDNDNQFYATGEQIETAADQFTVNLNCFIHACLHSGK